MKFFTVIFSIYILVLSFAPCGDNIDCREQANTRSEQTDHHHKTENCTPFCICACCGQIINLNITDTEISTVSNLLMEKTLLLYKETFLSEPSTKIWQPPKIA